MTHPNYKHARAFFEYMPRGELPDELLTPDMTGWTTTQGTMGKRAYQDAVKWLGVLFAEPPAFTIQSLTAEEDRGVAEATSVGTLVNGEEYRNSYIFVFRIRDDRIASIAEHYNALIVQEKLIPAMRAAMAKGA